MTTDTNCLLARRLWDATSYADADSIRALLAPDVHWTTVSSGDLSGSVVGADAVVDLFARSGELVDSLTSELVDIYTSPRGAVIQYDFRAERGHQSVATQMLLILRIEAERIVGARAIPVESEASTRFWSSQ